MSAPSLPDFMNLFDEFRASSWDGWRSILAHDRPAVAEPASGRRLPRVLVLDRERLRIGRIGSRCEPSTAAPAGR